VTRVGFGFDVHRFAPGDHLMLGLVRIPHACGIEAHSDGDVLVHALCDALLGASGLGDIGHHFPPSDERWRGAPGRLLLAETLRILKQAGFRPHNADLTAVCERPRLAPHFPAMRAALAEVLGLPESAVNLKATTSEGLGFTGRGEGIAAFAVAMVVPSSLG
jgi:2-C-methyl-D-erythritol 2,4-cyclodiphosphate synthase